MPARNELSIRANAVGLDPTTIPNDSKLEQKILWLEKRQSTIAGTAPTTTLTMSGIAANGETITFSDAQGTRVYTLRTALTSPAVPNEILIGAAATNTLDNIKDAINATSVSGGPGTTYGTGTMRNRGLTAGTKTATTLVIAATDSNAIGANLSTTETMVNGSFTGATLSAGTLGSYTSSNSTSSGWAGVSGDRNTTL
jgi:hypothetical protein